MKKNLFLGMIFFLTLAPLLFSQKTAEIILPSKEGKVVYSMVKEVPERLIPEQVSRAETWFESCDFPYERYEEQDPSRDILTGRGSTEILYGPNDFAQYYKKVKFEIELVVKRDRYQYSLSHFVVIDDGQESQLEAYGTSRKNGNRDRVTFYNRLDERVSEYIEQLHSYLVTETALSVH